MNNRGCPGIFTSGDTEGLLGEAVKQKSTELSVQLSQTSSDLPAGVEGEGWRAKLWGGGARECEMIKQAKSSNLSGF